MNQGPTCNYKTTSTPRQLTIFTTGYKLTNLSAALCRSSFGSHLLGIQPFLLGVGLQQTLRTTVRTYASAKSIPKPSLRICSSRRRLQDQAHFARHFTDLYPSTSTTTASPDDTHRDVSCSNSHNLSSNSTANGTSNGPQYDTYWPLPNTASAATQTPIPLLPEAIKADLCGNSSEVSFAPSAGASPLFPLPVTSWPPVAMQQHHQELGEQLLPPLTTPAAGPVLGGGGGAADPFSRDLREVAAAAVDADGKGAPAVDVTRHNFEVMLPVVKAYLAACDFFSFDCEMTGLFLEGQYENYLDDMQDRYSRTAAAAHSFVINQFGLSCFKRQQGLGPDGEKRYQAATFNFYLFPRPPEGAAALASSQTSKRFLCDAGSLAFLAAQGFDFNRCIYDGVSFIPVRQRDDLLRQLDRDNGGGGGEASRGDVELSKPEDLEFVTGLVASVRRWLDSNSDPAGTAPPGGAPTLDLPPVNRYLRLLAYQALARPENFGGPTGGAPGWHPGFYVKKVQDERNFTCIRLVRCATAAEAAALEAAERRQRRSAAAAAAGFAAVWEAMRDSGRPAVGHNCMFDVAYGIAQFGEGRLPATWQGFKGAVANWFRGGLYDTKHICRQLPELLGSDTSLGVMYGTLVANNGQDASAGGSSGAVTVGPLLPARVSVSHAHGFEKYVAVAAGQLAHEAGYDAFMTGSVFAALEAVMEARAVKDADGAPPAASASPYTSVVPYVWRLNVTRSDLPYALVRPVVPGDPSSVEPVPERPRVIYLSTLGPGVRAGDIHRCCDEAGLGKVRITFQPGNSALLELESREAVEAALGGALQGRGVCAEVLSYADFRARKDAMLASGAWPLPGYGSNRTGGAWGGGAGGFGTAAGGAAAGRGDAATARPAKRPRVGPEEEEEAELGGTGARQAGGSRCSIM